MSQIDLQKALDYAVIVVDNPIIKDIAESIGDSVGPNSTGKHLDIDETLDDGVEIGLSICKKDVEVQIKIPLDI